MGIHFSIQEHDGERSLHLEIATKEGGYVEKDLSYIAVTSFSWLNFSYNVPITLENREVVMINSDEIKSLLSGSISASEIKALTQKQLEIALKVGACFYNSKVLDPELVQEVTTHLRGSALFGDKEFLLKLVQVDGEFLQYASSELKNDYDVVSSAILQFPSAFQYASEQLRDNPALFFLATKRDEKMYAFGGSHCINQVDVLESVILVNPSILKEIIHKWGTREPNREEKARINELLTALDGNENFWKDIPSSILLLLQEKGVFNPFFERKPNLIEELSRFNLDDKDVIELFINYFAEVGGVDNLRKEDLENPVYLTVLARIFSNPVLLDKIPLLRKEVRENHPFTLKLIEFNEETIHHIDPRLKNDPIWIHEALKFQPQLLIKEFHESMQLQEEYRESLFKALQVDPHLFARVQESLREDDRFQIEACKYQEKVFEYSTHSWKQDPDTIFEILEQNPKLIKYLPIDFLRDHPNCYEIALRKNPLNLQYLPQDRQLANKRLVKEAIQQDVSVCTFLASGFLEDRTFLEAILLENPISIRSFPQEFLRTEEFIELYVSLCERKPELLSFAPLEMVENEIFYLKIVEKLTLIPRAMDQFLCWDLEESTSASFLINLCSRHPEVLSSSFDELIEKQEGINLLNYLAGKIPFRFFERFFTTKPEYLTIDNDHLFCRVLRHDVQAFLLLSEETRKNIPYLLKLINELPSIIQYFPLELMLHHPILIETAAALKPEIIQYLPEEFQLDHPALILKIALQNPLLSIYLSRNFQRIHESQLREIFARKSIDLPIPAIEEEWINAKNLILIFRKHQHLLLQSKLLEYVDRFPFLLFFADHARIPKKEKENLLKRCVENPDLLSDVELDKLYREHSVKESETATSIEEGFNAEVHYRHKRKALAQVAGLMGYIGKDRLQGHQTYFYAKKIAEVTRAVSMDEGDLIEIRSTFLQSANPMPDSSRLLELYRSGKAINLNTGYYHQEMGVGHAMNVVIKGDQLIICNRGDRRLDLPTMLFIKIDPDKIDEKIIQLILKSSIGKSADSQDFIIYDLLPKLVEVRLDGGALRSYQEQKEAIQKVLKSKEQKVGNCSCASQKAAFKALAFILEYEKLEDLPQIERIQQAGKKAKEASNQMSIALREMMESKLEDDRLSRVILFKSRCKTLWKKSFFAKTADEMKEILARKDGLTAALESPLLEITYRDLLAKLYKRCEKQGFIEEQERIKEEIIRLVQTVPIEYMEPDELLHSNPIYLAAREEQEREVSS